jgi:predicted DNA-binding ribbon-helix-helix protein
MTAPDDPGRMKKHSLAIAGHSTSVSLETAFWDALRELARERGVAVAVLVAEIDGARGDANLSSALRVHILLALQDRLRAQGS